MATTSMSLRSGFDDGAQDVASDAAEAVNGDATVIRSVSLKNSPLKWLSGAA